MPEHPSQRWRDLWRTSWLVPLLAGLITAGICTLTLQTHINGSNHAYATDVGELQNALPRWGTIHFSGYPLYSISGSLIVTLLRVVGIPPAMGASLVSLLWGALTAALVALLALELGAKRLAALIGAAIFSVSTSMWIDSSMAEVHSMTMALIAAILLFAVRFDRSGERRDLIWLVVVFSQGGFHGRSVMGLVPAVFLLVIPRRRMIWRNLPLLTGISLIAPLLYVYMPLREWMGSDWTFGNTSTWQGFWRMFLNIKAARFASRAEQASGWLERLQVTLNLFNDDLPLVLQGLGFAGLFTLKKPKNEYGRYAAALVLAWLPFAAVPVIIYTGFIGDAILAVKLPISMLAGLGLALLISRLHAWRAAAGYGALALAAAGIVFAGWRNFPSVIAITRDRGVEEAIAIADQAANPDNPTTLMVLWGHNYWGVAYAQKYRGQLAGVTLVDHNAPFEKIVAEGNTLLTLSETFYVRPVGWWEDLLGPVYLDTYAPGLIEIRTAPRVRDSAATLFIVNDDLAIEFAEVRQTDDGGFVVTVRWQALQVPQRDYSVAVHLIAADPPSGPQDILAQADSAHPVEGWYPTRQWALGQVVQDVFRLTPPPGTQPVAIRVTAYYVNEAGEFVNGNWLVLRP